MKIYDEEPDEIDRIVEQDKWLEAAKGAMLFIFLLVMVIIFASPIAKLLAEALD